MHLPLHLPLPLPLYLPFALHLPSEIEKSRFKGIQEINAAFRA